MLILDCTLRDGGYYNQWDFPQDVMNQYLHTMADAGVDIVELGLRSLINDDFKGPCAYTTDDFILSLQLPAQLQIAVMVNAVELLKGESLESVLTKLFPTDAINGPVDVVRVACHVHEFERALPACLWLKQRGFLVGFNLMQVADRSQQEIEQLAKVAAGYPLDALYFADSMGSMDPAQTVQIVQWLRSHWQGALGIHTHDNMGLALQNTLAALDAGVSWLDATVTGMGRGPGNARTEELAIEIAARRGGKVNFVPLLALIRSYFQPLKNKCGWGSNPYYYLSGKYGIHPTYIQEMLGDSRYSEEDLFAAIEYLRTTGGKKFSNQNLDASRQFYQGEGRGSWQPAKTFHGRTVLLLGTGPGVAAHKHAIELYIRRQQPLVVALNTQSAIAQELIDLRIACHPMRLLADCKVYRNLPQPLITPLAQLPADIQRELNDIDCFDFGLTLISQQFEFHATSAVLPTSLVACYALAVAAAGQAAEVLMAGFDGYAAEDPRNSEMNRLLALYQDAEGATPLTAVTPTRYELTSRSIYGLA